jgi:superfamily II DNA helicase RecQ
MYSIPVMGGELLMEEMNVFLRSKKVLQVEKHFLPTAQSASWTFCISYLDDSPPVTEKARVDYRQVLDEVSFKRFSKMREIRKQLADDMAVPAFAIFNDEEMSNLAKMEDLTLAKMKTVKGIGDKKIEKYGQHFLIKTDG